MEENERREGKAIPASSSFFFLGSFRASLLLFALSCVFVPARLFPVPPRLRPSRPIHFCHPSPTSVRRAGGMVVVWRWGQRRRAHVGAKRPAAPFADLSSFCRPLCGSRPILLVPLPFPPPSVVACVRSDATTRATRARAPKGGAKSTGDSRKGEEGRNEGSAPQAQQTPTSPRAGGRRWPRPRSQRRELMNEGKKESEHGRQKRGGKNDESGGRGETRRTKQKRTWKGKRRRDKGEERKKRGEKEGRKGRARRVANFPRFFFFFFVCLFVVGFFLSS